MKRETRGDPRRLPNPEELRKTTEPFDQIAEDASLKGAAIKQQAVNSSSHLAHRR
jgi:hypothetical protein